METFHCPVMVEEVVSALKITPGGVYMDCTVGEGGHSLAISEASDPGPQGLRPGQERGDRGPEGELRRPKSRQPKYRMKTTFLPL